MSQLSYHYNKHRRRHLVKKFLGSIVVSIPVCHTGDRGSIPRQGVCIFFATHLYGHTLKVTGQCRVFHAKLYMTQLIY